MELGHRLTSIHFSRYLERRSLRQHPPGATVLMYHEVLPDDWELPNWCVVRESWFRSQVAHLNSHYQVLSLDEILDRFAEKPADRLSGKPMAAITFDDGYAGNLHCAAPILEELNLPFTVYIATAQVERDGLHWYDRAIIGLLARGSHLSVIPTSAGPIHYSSGYFWPDRRWAAINDILTRMKKLPGDEREMIAAELYGEPSNTPLRMLTPQEVARLATMSCATVGCHTHGHELLDTIPLADAKASILRAQKLLAEWTGRTAPHFSYPNGNHTPPVTALVRELGFVSAVTTRNAIWTAGTDPLRIPRIGIGRFDNMNLFRAKVAGFFSGRP